MRRVWFTDAMKQAILEGRKTVTTRNHPLKLEAYQAVSGSRYAAQPFAVIRIQDRMVSNLENVIDAFYRPEGFSSRDEMRGYLRKHRLDRQLDGVVYVHFFRVVPEAAT